MGDYAGPGFPFHPDCKRSSDECEVHGNVGMGTIGAFVLIQEPPAIPPSPEWTVPPAPDEVWDVTVILEDISLFKSNESTPDEDEAETDKSFAKIANVTAEALANVYMLTAAHVAYDKLNMD